MRLFRRCLGYLTCLSLMTFAASARAEAPQDPLRLVPDKADFFFKVEQPRKLAETIYGLDLFKRLQKLDAVVEAYDSTNARRFFQLVAYFEKQLGMKWPEIIDRVAGGGMAVGVKIGGDPSPVLLVVQSKDEKALDKFVKLALKVVDQELARQEAKDRPVKGSYHNVETVQIGKQFCAALAGSALLISNKSEALHLAIDLHGKGGKNSVAQLPGVADARKVLPSDPLAWGRLTFDNIRKFPQAKAVFAEKQNDTNLTVLFGGFLDLLRRSPFVC